MTRFDAADPTERRKLVADAVRAHRERAGSDFLTVEGAWAEAREEAEEGDPAPLPWVQFADRTFNLDVTDDELARLNDLLGEFPEFRVEARESPEEAEGTNVRVTAKSDAGRLAMFVDRAFVRVYGAPEDYRLWVVAV
ncbi:MAG: hypothetical protein ABEJ43_09100 [Haloferacaceae archaeon]